MKTSNYDRVAETWRCQFLTWDHEVQMKKLGYDTYDETNLYITYLMTPYGINRKSGKITNLQEPVKMVGFSTQMALYHVLWYSRENPTPSGHFVPFRDVKRAGVFDTALQKQTIKPTADLLSGKADKLKKVAIKKGLSMLSIGDVSFFVEAFPKLFFEVIFWDGDEEFPAQLTLLFDENITDFTHEETVVMMAGDVCQFLVGCIQEESV